MDEDSNYMLDDIKNSFSGTQLHNVVLNDEKKELISSYYPITFKNIKISLIYSLFREEEEQVKKLKNRLFRDDDSDLDYKDDPDDKNYHNLQLD